LGIATRIDDRPDGWCVWVINEDHLSRARQELDAYRQSPDDPRYHSARQSAESIRRESQRLDREYQRNFRNMSSHWDRTNFRRRPVTITLMAISVLVYFAMNFMGNSKSVLDLMLFAPPWIDQHGQLHRGLSEIARGQVWRLITPIFLHFGPMHILF